MKYKAILLLLFLTFHLGFGGEAEYQKDWISPEKIEVKGKNITYTVVGFVIFKKEKVYDVISQKYGGRFYLSSDLKGTKATRLRPHSFDLVSKFKNKKVRVTGTVSQSKTKLALSVKTCKNYNQKTKLIWNLVALDPNQLV